MNIVETFSHNGIDVRMMERRGAYECSAVGLQSIMCRDVDRVRCRTNMIHIIDSLDGKIGQELYRGFRITYATAGSGYIGKVSVGKRGDTSLRLIDAIRSVKGVVDTLVLERIQTRKRDLREALDSEDWIEAAHQILDEITEMRL